ncbi:uncharacterized protein B0H18DRAFT_431688 [Fomitopsis serialis]|uniref:uncharacterized protein n=1 Tax=Fomitopsis serialis TaxID=139415 RepID=UPI0020086F43|nr:uncharacterized protein B0H18DRAFT_431688 [Neoantrodia serialis]KAH9924424.1 hypothetical protein B0H18DRAFT_431688 [Neoantrodia serialis]
MSETQTYPALHLTSPDRIQLLPGAGSHDWSSEAGGVEVSQLVRLASQHHASEYSRLKFGPKGCPVAYVPFSVQMPERVKQLQAHQARYATRQVWWLCEKRATVSTMIADDAPGSQAQPRLSYPSSNPDIQQELRAAISSRLVPPYGWPTAYLDQSSVKTSCSHPINLSSIIPLELLGIISPHLSRNDDHSPVMFDLPLTHFLDRIVSQSPVLPTSVTSTSLSRSYPCPSNMTEQPLFARSPVHSSSRSVRLTHLLLNNPTLRRALQLTASSHGKHCKPVSTTAQPTTLPAKVDEKTVPSRTCLHEEIASAQDALRRSHSTSSVLTQSRPDKTGGIGCPAAGEVRLDTSPQHRRSSSFSTLRVPLDMPLLPALSDERPPLPALAPQPWLLGNLYLSSCPGKKVRLSGPVKGKCGVCRDLRMDLQRIKDFGIACTVCCLDDEELKLLGVPWADYSAIADEVGLDVLRIPTPEGLTPSSVSDFDAQLTKLIRSYTVNGLNVLVHCRGGVGRAGLVACCWMLKLGLCGGTEFAASTTPEDLPTMEARAAETTLPVKKETMQLIERVITVVRRRRSPKAVETYEQVRFLVDFVEYQQRTMRVGSALGSRQDLTRDVD